MKVAVLKGGDSPERDVSLVSGAEIAKGLVALGYEVLEVDPADYPDKILMLTRIKEIGTDVVFNALHGGSGENGEIQALFKQALIPLTGSSFSTCVLTMDKFVSKLIVAKEGIPVPKYLLLRENLLDEYESVNDFVSIKESLGIPLVIKPNDAGSSVGISIVDDLNDLKGAVKSAFDYSSSVLIEEYIPGRELTVTVLNGKALPVVEIKPKNGFYDYANKYSRGNTIYVAPAELSESESTLLQIYAERVWHAFSCRGYARIDFRYNGEVFYFLEVNTLPGMTPLSLSPMSAQAAGISFTDLLRKIIETTSK